MSGTILIACEVVVEELRLIIPEDLPVRVIDPILHLQPEKLRAELQKAIDEEEKRYDTLLLGFGLCSRAVEGLKSTTAPHSCASRGRLHRDVSWGPARRTSTG